MWSIVELIALLISGFLYFYPPTRKEGIVLFKLSFLVGFILIGHHFIQEMKLAPRVISSKQENVLIEKLSMFPEKQISIWIWNDSDNNIFAKKIVEIFIRSGWGVETMHVMNPSSLNSEFVVVIKNKIYEKSGLLLRNLFLGLGFNCSEIFNENSSANLILQIGSKNK